MRRVQVERAPVGVRALAAQPGVPAERWRRRGASLAGRKVGHCSECKLRLCAIERGITTCSECPDYACEQLAAFFQMVPQTRLNLDALRTG